LTWSLDRDRPVRHRSSVVLVRDQRLEVEHLEDPVEAHDGTHDLDPSTGQRGQWRVQPGEEQSECHDGTGVELPAECVEAAESVDQRECERGHQGQGGDEHPLHHRGPDPDVAYSPRPALELG
jgi:hypothetical protein